MFLAYKDKKRWIKTVRKAVCFIKILDSVCCNALVKRDGKQQKDGRNSVMSLLFTQHNMGTNIIGFQITVVISYIQTRSDPMTQVHNGPRWAEHSSHQRHLRQIKKMLPNLSKLSSHFSSGHPDVMTDRIHVIYDSSEKKWRTVSHFAIN